MAKNIVEVMIACNNYFLREAYFSENLIISENGIENGFDEDEVKVGDYILISRYSMFKEVYKVTEVTAASITFEEVVENFDGAGYVCKCAISPPFLQLCEDIESYQSTHKKDGLASESIPNYSYTRSEDGLKGWQSVFASELGSFKKLPKEWGLVLLEATKWQ